MRPRFPELERLRISVSDDTRRRHLESISAQLANRPPSRRRLSRRVLAVAVAAASLIPTAAVASENSVPGDALYPVKLVLEPIRAIIDVDVIARHRVTELEVLVDSEDVDSLSDGPVDSARDALRAVNDPELRQRFDRVVDQLTERSDGSTGAEVSGEEEPPVTDRPAPDRGTTTTTAPVDRLRDRDRPASTTTTTRPSDRPPSDG